MSFGQFLSNTAGHMAAQSATYEPNSMVEWGHDVAELQNMLTQVAGVLGGIGHGADNLPIDPAVKETIASVEALIHQCASAAGEIHSTFRTVHADDLKRIENPRQGEDKWDVRVNR